MATHKLLLHPADPQCLAIKTDVLAKHLQSIGLIGEPVRLITETIYPAGEHFLQLITFLGCSPMIELELPVDAESLETGSRDGRFCNIVFTENGGNLLFRGDEHSTEPRCPQCHKPEKQWSEKIHAWQNDPHRLDWSCLTCGYTGQLTELNFRKSAGFGKNFIEIRSIYPSEAIPGAVLLARLQTLTDCRWNTLYIKE